ncbi:MAG: GDSL-type esterase/lipase family protein [Verrucomicrobiae bacterium]|jgi:lysophospholipase L1-like esterase
MKFKFNFSILLTLVVGASTQLGFTGCASVPPNSLAHHDASRWQGDIAAFAASDATNPPPRGCIVFTGSSYIRKWTTLASDFPGLPVVNRGFGGCQLADVYEYADRIVIPYAPREVVIYAGGNDISSGKSPELVFGDFVALMTKLHTVLPAAKLVFISCPPSPKRWEQTGKIKEVNGLIADYCRDHQFVFVDTFSLMLGADGQPKPEIYSSDRLHMNATGYAIWRQAVAPCLQ